MVHVSSYPDINKEGRMKVLMIDDDKSSLDNLGESLCILGYTVKKYSNPKEAVLAHKKEKFNLVITDYHMTEMNGIEVIRAIKQHDADIPIILLSGNADEEIEKLSVQSGASAFLTKPLDFEKLMDLITSFS